MEKFKRDIIFILLLYMNLIYVAWLSVPCYLIEGFDYIYVSFLIALGSAVFLIYRHVISKRSYRIGATISAVCIAIICLFIRRVWVITFINMLYINFNEIINKVYNSTPNYFLQYKPIISITVPPIVMVLLIIISVGFYDVTIFGSLTFMIVLWYCGFSDIIKEKLFVYVFISSVTFIVNSYLRTLKSLDKRGIKTVLKFGEFFICSVLCSLLIAALIPRIPKTSPGKYSSGIKNKIEAKFEGEEGSGITQNGTQYSLASSGYGDSSSKLGGPVIIDDKLELKVKADKPLYLRGTVKNYYDGFTWARKNIKMIKKEKQELLPLTGANAFTIFGKLNKLFIYPVNLKTTTVLAPEYVFNIDIANNDIYYDKNFTYQTKKNITDSYEVTYTPYKDNLGVISNSIDGKEFKEMDDEYRFSIQERPYIMSKYSEYLQLPSNIPQRVYDLVAEITSGCSTNGEKAERIYKYLKNTYKYSLNVSEVPKDREFVDYFLFTEKKGYCTYFATAATIMCRIAGVPARYAEGFNMTDVKDNDGLFLVTNRNAHAWTEILMGPGTNLWTILDCVPDAEEQIAQETSLNLNNDASTANNDAQTINAQRRRDKEDPADNPNGTSNSAKLSTWQKMLITVLSGILLYFITLCAFRILRRYRIIKNKSIIPLYLYYLSKLKLLGFKRPKNFGDMEFAYGVEDNDLRSRIIVLVKAAYAEHFGGKEIDDIDKKEYYSFITSYIKKEKHKFR